MISYECKQRGYVSVMKRSSHKVSQNSEQATGIRISHEKIESQGFTEQ